MFWSAETTRRQGLGLYKKKKVCICQESSL